jgi:hypothetical protein
VAHLPTRLRKAPQHMAPRLPSLGLGLSGRPESAAFSNGTTKKGWRRRHSDPRFSPRAHLATDEALVRCEDFQKLAANRLFRDRFLSKRLLLPAPMHNTTLRSRSSPPRQVRAW